MRAGRRVNVEEEGRGRRGGGWEETYRGKRERRRRKANTTKEKERRWKNNWNNRGRGKRKTWKERRGKERGERLRSKGEDGAATRASLRGLSQLSGLKSSEGAEKNPQS